MTIHPPIGINRWGIILPITFGVTVAMATKQCDYSKFQHAEFVVNIRNVKTVSTHYLFVQVKTMFMLWPTIKNTYFL